MLSAVVFALLAGPPAEALPPRRVAVISPTGAEQLPALEPALVEALDARGFSTTRLRPSSPEGSACADSMVEPSCVAQLRRGWNDQRPPLMVLGSIAAESGSHRVQLLVLHRDESEPIARFDARFVDDDLVLPIVFPVAVADAIERHGHPPPVPTEQELALLSRLDEPSGPTSPSAEASPPAEASPQGERGGDAPRPSRRMEPVVQAMEDRALDEALHLRRDFDEVCRRGPRRRRQSRDDPRDLRPHCSLGPVLGYVRPRTWVTATLAVASGIASGIAFRAQRGPHGEETRRKAGAWGTATAATSAVLGVGVITLSIGDRWQARRYLRDERWLAAQ